ncbi:MAG: hypothetical protein HYY51_01225 [Candidatus Magasanikbacteria bacterium]|nr:hypothetical protein [Candidatus Magasanikbacteria bacterium]
MNVPSPTPFFGSDEPLHEYEQMKHKHALLEQRFFKLEKEYLSLKLRVDEFHRQMDIRDTLKKIIDL